MGSTRNIIRAKAVKSEDGVSRHRQTARLLTVSVIKYTKFDNFIYLTTA